MIFLIFVSFVKFIGEAWSVSLVLWVIKIASVCEHELRCQVSAASETTIAGIRF